MLAVVFPPFAQRLENSVSRACWPGSMSLGVFHSSHGLCYCSRLYGQANGEQIWDPEGANHVPPPHLPDDPKTLVTKAEIDDRPLCRVAPQFERVSDFLGCDGNVDTIPRSPPAAETTHYYACTYCKYLLAFLDEG